LSLGDHGDLGETAFRRGDYGKALRLFGQSLKLYGDQPKTAALIGEIVKKSDDLAGKAQWVLANYVQRGAKPGTASAPGMPGENEPRPRRNEKGAAVSLHAAAPQFSQRQSGSASDLYDVDRARTLGARLGVERHGVVFGQRLEAGTLDATMVDEYVLAAVVRGDEAETLAVTEPLHFALSHLA